MQFLVNCMFLKNAFSSKPWHYTFSSFNVWKMSALDRNGRASHHHKLITQIRLTFSQKNKSDFIFQIKLEVLIDITVTARYLTIDV